MPFEIVRNDIINMRVDAIVNSANPRAVVGLGTDSSIHEKAGPELLAARQKIGSFLWDGRRSLLLTDCLPSMWSTPLARFEMAAAMGMKFCSAAAMTDP